MEKHKPIREIRDALTNKYFVGRKVYIDEFNAIKDQVNSDKLIYYLHGIPGIGKSTLLKQFYQGTSLQNNYSIFCDLRVYKTALQIAETIIERLPRGSTGKLLRIVNNIKGIRSKAEVALGSITDLLNLGVKAAAPDLLAGFLDDSVTNNAKQRLANLLNPKEIDLFSREDYYIAQGIIDLLRGEDPKDKPIFFFDSLEQSPQLEKWIVENLLGSGLTSNIFIVVASQKPPSGVWKTWLEVTTSRLIEPFTNEEAHDYLSLRKVAKDDIGAYSRESKLIPWALAVLVDAKNLNPTEEQSVYFQDMRIQVVTKLLNNLNKDAKELVFICSLARWFNLDILETIFPRLDLEMFTELTELSIVRGIGNERWIVNDNVKSYLFNFARNERPSWFKANNSLLANYHKQAIKDLGTGEKLLHLVEYAYHGLLEREEEGLSVLRQALDALVNYHNPGLIKSLLFDLKEVVGTRESLEWLRYYGAELTYLSNDETTAEMELTSLRDETSSFDIEIASSISLGRIYRRQGRTADAVDILNNCRMACAEHGSLLGLGRTNHVLSASLRRLGAWKEAISLSGESEQIFRKLDSPEEVAWAISERGFAEMFRGNFPTAINLFENALNNLENFSSKQRSAETRRRLGRTLIYTGNWVRSHNLLQEALGAFKQINDEYGTGRTSNHIGYLSTLQGHYYEAQEHLDFASTVFSHFKAWLQVGMNNSYRGYLEYSRGNYSKARDFIKIAKELIFKVNDAFHTSEVLFFWGYGEFLAGNTELARQAFTKCIDSIKAEPQTPDFYRAYSLAYMALLSCEANNYSDARGYIKRVREFGNQYSSTKYDAVLPQLYLAEYLININSPQARDHYKSLNKLKDGLIVGLKFNVLNLYSIIDLFMSKFKFQQGAIAQLAKYWREYNSELNIIPEEMERNQRKEQGVPEGAQYFIDLLYSKS